VTPRAIEVLDRGRLQSWYLHEETSHFFTDHTVIVDPVSDAVIVYQATTRDLTLTIVQEIQWSRGPIVTYRPSDIDRDAYDLSQSEIDAMVALCRS
jgi:hypothetical protein